MIVASIALLIATLAIVAWALIRKLRRRPERDLYPGIPEECFGGCGRCHRSWKRVECHSTRYSENSGCFPLCEECWASLTPRQRIFFYRRMFESWSPRDATDWEKIAAAVLEGK